MHFAHAMLNRQRSSSDALKEQERTNAIVRMERSRKLDPGYFCGHPACMQQGHWVSRLHADPVNLVFPNAAIDVGHLPIHSERRQSPLPKQDFMFFLRIEARPGALLPERLVERLGVTSYMTATLNMDPHVRQKTIVVRALLDQTRTVLDMVNRLEAHTAQHPAGTPEFAKLVVHPHDTIKTHFPSGIFTTDNDSNDFRQCVQPLIDILTIEKAVWIDAAPRAPTPATSRWAVAGPVPAAPPSAPPAAPPVQERGEGGAGADDPAPREERELAIPSPSSDMSMSSGPPSPTLSIGRSRSRAQRERSPTPTLESQLVHFEPDPDRLRMDERKYRSASLAALPKIRHQATNERIPHPLTPMDKDPNFQPPSDMEDDDTQEQACGGGFDNGGSGDEEIGRAHV